MNRKAVPTQSSCFKCEYDLSGLRAGTPCPECGITQSLLFETPTWSVRRCRCAQSGALLLIGLAFIGVPCLMILSYAGLDKNVAIQPDVVWLIIQSLLTLGVVLISAAVSGSYERLFSSTLWPIVLAMLVVASARLLFQGNEGGFWILNLIGIAATLVCMHLVLMRYGDLAGQPVIYDRARRSLVGIMIALPVGMLSIPLLFVLIGIPMVVFAFFLAIRSLILTIEALVDFFTTVSEMRR